MEVESNVVNTEASGSGAGHKGKMEGNRRPMNAFLLFCKRHRAIVKEVYPNLENRHITKILGEFWGSLSQEEKLPFNDLAASYKDHLMREGQAGGGKRGSQTKAAATAAPVLNQPMEINEEKAGNEVKSGQGSSGSSSPEPPGGQASSAPKPFKKRYLAAEKAKIATTASTVASSGESSERKSACEALLKLAEGSQAVTTTSSNENNSQGSTNGSVKSNPYDKVKESAQFTVLRQAVWTRVAKTILTQEEEKGKMSNKQDVDKPINLSSQCLIPNSTIIEHIIENIINDDNGDVESAKSSNNDEVNKPECSEQIKEKIYQSLKEDITRRTAVGGKAKDGSNDLTALWKMLPNPIGGNPTSTTTAKKNGIQADTSIKKAHSAPASQSGSGAPSPKGASSSSASGNGGNGNGAAEPAVSVTLVTSESDLPLNLSKTPPATPSSSLSTGIAITITTSSPAKRKLLDEDDDDLRRSSRACKGRRYQEFKDAVGHRRSTGGGGRAASGSAKVYMGKSDGESSQHSEDEMAPNSASRPPAAPQQSSPKGESKPVLLTGSLAPAVSSAFDLEKALMNIPALRPEEFQRRIQMSRQRSSTTTSSSSHLSAPLRGTAQNDNTTAMDTTNSSMTSLSDQVANQSGRRTKSASSASRPPPSSSESTLVVSAHGH